jgi:ATPase subunit of ABC transporter with duplicated ATPase domains
MPRHTIARLDYKDYVSRRLDSLAHQETVARKEKEEFDKQQERWRQIYDKVEREQNNISRQDPHGGRLLKKKMKAVKSLGRRFERESGNMTQLPDVEDAIFAAFDSSVSVPNSKDILRFELDELRAGASDIVLARNIKLTLIGPERVGIIGRNGAGKSTLLKLLAAELLKRKDIRAAYMPQNYAELLTWTSRPLSSYPAARTRRQ